MLSALVISLALLVAPLSQLDRHETGNAAKGGEWPVRHWGADVEAVLAADSTAERIVSSGLLRRDEFFGASGRKSTPNGLLVAHYYFHRSDGLVRVELVAWEEAVCEHMRTAFSRAVGPSGSQDSTIAAGTQIRFRGPVSREPGFMSCALVMTALSDDVRYERRGPMPD